MVAILGDGLLGTELNRITNWDVISRKKHQFDITDPSTFNILLNWFNDPHNGKLAGTPRYTTLINCIANTDTYSLDRKLHWDVNYKGVAELVDFCNHWRIKLVHISSDYVYANSSGAPTEEDVPVHQETYYAYTKLLADGYIELKSKDYLVIRTTHKPTPFPYTAAWIDQIGNFDYVDVVAPLIVDMVVRDQIGIFNIGTEVKSMLDLAKRTNPDVQPAEITSYNVPRSTIMNLDKYKNIK